MEKSIFYGWLQAAFGPIITRFVETLNGVNGAQPVYYFQQHLGKQFSVDLKWGSINSENSQVAADVVALDASVPLKSRDTFGTAEGEVPKMGMKMRKSEREMQELQTMEALNINGRLSNQILTRLFNDPLRVTRGIYERLEYMYLEGLSTGYTTVSENINEGIAIRASFGYDPEQISGVPVAWSDPAADPISDIDRIKEEARAKGRTINFMLMDRVTMNNFRNKTSVKELYAARIGFYGATLPTPDFEQTNQTLAGNDMPQIVLIDRTVTIEKNAKRTPVKPWANGAVVFTDSMAMGDVFWSTLVESRNPKADVLYATVNDYILVSEWHTNDPFSEIISSQALAMPVIDNPLGKWVLNTETVVVAADPFSEDFSSLKLQSLKKDPLGKSDDKELNKGGVSIYTKNNEISYNGANYKRNEITKALNATGEGSKLKGNQKNETLEERIKELSPEGRAKFDIFLTRGNDGDEVEKAKEAKEPNKSKGSKDSNKSKGSKDSKETEGSDENKGSEETDNKE